MMPSDDLTVFLRFMGRGVRLRFERDGFDLLRK